MEYCAKCGKSLEGEFFKTAYGENRCEACYDDYLMTDKGKVEYFIGICNEDYPMSDFDADFLGHVATCWKKYRVMLDMKIADVLQYEAKAENLGLL
jgi:DNA-directed RNA polymerase subunit RPC12/RpoP